MPGLGGDLGERAARSAGVSSAGLSTTVLPAASAGRELPRGDRQREVPRHDQPDDPERLAHRERLAAGDRDRVAEQSLGRARVVAERLRRPCPSRRARRRSACRRCAPRAGPAPRACASSASASAAQRARPAAPGRARARLGTRPWRARPRRRPRSAPARGTSCEHRLGGGLDDRQAAGQRSAPLRSTVGSRVPSGSDRRALGADIVDRADRALERALGRREVPDRHRQHDDDRDQRRIVDRRPAEACC